MSQNQTPGAEFGIQKPLSVGNRRYISLTTPTTTKIANNKNEKQKLQNFDQEKTKIASKNQQNQQNSSSTTLSSTSNLFPAPNLSSKNGINNENYEPVDKNGIERTMIHGIPIIKHPKTLNYTLIFPFPAILSPSITRITSINLPKPTQGGTIQLLLSNQNLKDLLLEYKKIFEIIFESRNFLPYTHFFGIPLGPVHPICYDLANKSDKRVIKSIEHYSDSGTDTSNYRFHTKFMASETSQQLALNIVKAQKKMGLDTTHTLDMVLMKHNNYNDNKNNGNQIITGDKTLEKNEKQNNNNGKNFETKNEEEKEEKEKEKKNSEVTNIDELNLKLHLDAAMPVPKLHCTTVLLRILSLDEFNIVIDELSRQQQIIYDALGGTSVSLRIEKIDFWNILSNYNKDQNKAKHCVAILQEVYKDGKISSGDYISTGSVLNNKDGEQKEQKKEQQPDQEKKEDEQSNQQKNKNQGHYGLDHDNKAPDQQKCPRLALVTGILAHSMLKIGTMTPSDLATQRIGSQTGQNCGVSWHMTLFNNKYAQTTGYHSYPSSSSSSSKNQKNQKNTQEEDDENEKKLINLSKNFMLDIKLCQKGINSIHDWGQHRAPCINLYRMGSRLIIPKGKEDWYDLDQDNLYNSFPARHKVLDHYTIDYSLPLP